MSTTLQNVSPGELVKSIMGVIKSHATRIERWKLGKKADIEKHIIVSIKYISMEADPFKFCS
jgi:hypothetical protein